MRAAALEQPDAVFYLCGSKRLVPGARRELVAVGVGRMRMMIESFF